MIFFLNSSSHLWAVKFMTPNNCAFNTQKVIIRGDDVPSSFGVRKKKKNPSCQKKKKTWVRRRTTALQLHSQYQYVPSTHFHSFGHKDHIFYIYLCFGCRPQRQCLGFFELISASFDKMTFLDTPPPNNPFNKGNHPERQYNNQLNLPSTQSTCTIQQQQLPPQYFELEWKSL